MASFSFKSAITVAAVAAWSESVIEGPSAGVDGLMLKPRPRVFPGSMRGAIAKMKRISRGILSRPKGASPEALTAVESTASENEKVEDEIREAEAHPSKQKLESVINKWFPESGFRFLDDEFYKAQRLAHEYKMQKKRCHNNNAPHCRYFNRHLESNKHRHTIEYRNDNIEFLRDDFLWSVRDSSKSRFPEMQWVTKQSVVDAVRNIENLEEELLRTATDLALARAGSSASDDQIREITTCLKRNNYYLFPQYVDLTKKEIIDKIFHDVETVNVMSMEEAMVNTTP